MTTDYKTVFQLAQDKGYKLYCLSKWARGNNRYEIYELNNYSLIELTLIQKWLRDEHKINVFCLPTISFSYWNWNIQTLSRKDHPYKSDGKRYSYESALLEGIHEALKLI